MKNASEHLASLKEQCTGFERHCGLPNPRGCLASTNNVSGCMLI